jgi:hypothetical protein
MEIATAYVQNVVRYGHREPGELNEKLESFLGRTLSAPASDSQAGQTAKTLLEQYRQKTAQEMAAPKVGTPAPAQPPPTQQVTGQKLETTDKPATVTQPTRFNWPVMLIGGLVILLLIGLWKKIGVLHHDKRNVN